MYKLIKLELKKMKFGGLIRNVIIANIILTFWIVFSKGGHEEGYLDYGTAFADIGTYVRITFIIFSAVLMARMVIDEYRNKTISVLFTYPIQRKKLILAKLIPISILTFATLIVSNIFVAAVFLGFDSYYNFVPQALTVSIIVEEFARTIIFSVAAVGTSLIPLFFGMNNKSVPATIVTSFILSQIYMAIMNNNRIYNNFIVAIAVSIAWVVLGFVMSYIAIRNIEIDDIN